MATSESKSPLRMCVACRQMLPKQSLLRVVKCQGEVKIDHTGKAEGRGAYLCGAAECLKKCIKGRLFNRAFKCNVPESFYAEVGTQIDDNKQ